MKQQKFYVCEGATLQCSCGTTQSIFKPLKNHSYINGKMQGTADDYHPNINIFPFGHCNGLNKPCLPLITNPWMNVKKDHLIENSPCITNQSVLLCKASKGTIRIVDPGQNFSSDGARVPFFILRQRYKEHIEKQKQIAAYLEILEKKEIQENKNFFMRRDLNELADLQEKDLKNAKNFETVVLERYKDFWDSHKQNDTITVIGLRRWGSGYTPERFSKNNENPYDDLLNVLDKNGNLFVFNKVNFEGSNAIDTVNIGGIPTTLDGKYPSIKDGTYKLYTQTHSGYKALNLNENGSIPIREKVHPREPERDPPYALGIHIHKGGEDWTWSHGCLTILKKDWSRFMNIFPDESVGIEVGVLKLITKKMW